MRPIADLAADAADELQRGSHAEPDARAPYLRRAASLFIDIREQCTDPKGRGPDYAGRSTEYRSAVSAVFASLEGLVPEDDLRRMKSMLRYHYSNIIRDRLKDDPETLELYGLQAKSQAQRNTEWSQQRQILQEAGLLSQEADEQGRTSRLVHAARRLTDLAARAGIEDCNQDARDFIQSSVHQMAADFADLLPATELVRVAQDLLSRVKPEDLAGSTDGLRALQSSVDLLRSASGDSRGLRPDFSA